MKAEESPCIHLHASSRGSNGPIACHLARMGATTQAAAMYCQLASTASCLGPQTRHAPDIACPGYCMLQARHAPDVACPGYCMLRHRMPQPRHGPHMAPPGHRMTQTRHAPSASSSIESFEKPQCQAVCRQIIKKEMANKWKKWCA